MSPIYISNIISLFLNMFFVQMIFHREILERDNYLTIPLRLRTDQILLSKTEPVDHQNIC